MCGISGVVGISSTANAEHIIEVMNSAIAHRGPDDSGYFVEEGIALGQRRLSIIDLSSAGHQPMASADGNLILVFNGEIYNYQELKRDLSDYPFQTKTDTEVILAAFQKWGTACVQRFNGMFAFAIWDRAKEELHIFRDRLGIKPLYYYQNGSATLFASEIRALLKSGLVPKKLNKQALSDYLRYQTVHAPQTIITGVQMLMPGSFLKVSSNGTEYHQYWSVEKNYNREVDSKTYYEVTKDINSLLQAAVERRLIADVPFGAFLSGGIDSSIIVGLMSRLSTNKVKTFSVTFEEKEFSEAKYASIIATKFATDHHEIKLRPYDFLELIPAALKAMDHPSGDGPNTFVVSKVTKEAGITMALSGLGGDELFAGYDVFKRLSVLKNYQWLTHIPLTARRAIGTALLSTRPSVALRKISQLMSLPTWKLSNTYPITRQVLSDEVIENLIGGSVHDTNYVNEIVDGILMNLKADVGNVPLLSQISLAEINTYMQNTLLRDTDQMSMAHALEVRVPFLDFELLEYVIGVPDKYKYPTSPKKLLTDAIGDLLPDEIINRTKMGFTLPWNEWLKNELKTFCDDRISKLAHRSFFVKHEVEGLWHAFLSGDPMISWSRVWYLIVLENWLEEHGIE